MHTKFTVSCMYMKFEQGCVLWVLCVCTQDLVADDISPGLQLSTMLADILEDASSLHSLSLANNHLDDTAVANIMRALAANGDVQLTNLDLSGNSLLAPVSR